jgi:hypothetical protein
MGVLEMVNVANRLHATAQISAKRFDAGFNENLYWTVRRPVDLLVLAWTDETNWAISRDELGMRGR